MIFDVGDANVGDDGDVGCGERGQRRDFAGMIHADLEDANLVAAARAEQGQGQSNVIVEIPLGSCDLEVLAEHCSGQILGARFPIAPGKRIEL